MLAALGVHAKVRPAFPLLELLPARSAEVLLTRPTSEMISQILPPVVALGATGAARPELVVAVQHRSHAAPSTATTATTATIATTALGTICTMVSKYSVGTGGKHRAELAVPPQDLRFVEQNARATLTEMVVPSHLRAAPEAELSAAQASHLIASLTSFDGLSTRRAPFGGFLDQAQGLQLLFSLFE